MKNSDYLDINFLKSTGCVPQWFGLGFVQMKLDENKRLHFWHPGCAMDTPEDELHDHRYDFTSKVLLGTVNHEVWDWREDLAGDYEMFEVSCKPGAPADPRPIARGNVVMSGRYLMSAGSEYLFPHHQFHRASTSLGVTLLERGPVVKENARVIHLVGQPTVCAFSRPRATDECWGIIADILASASV